ncbi:uncharacterized protein LOC127102895 [Lathyrus oleraceus]|uniref:uncharacterized protein LOC127102895 n=1 Tax=Pisum sativum TaxID=3888 RepID=UPI0021D3C437|nr:uncharacterized protein LOC127102895 [Pisum sativum]
MTSKLNCGEPKPTQTTLTLSDHSITYPYKVLDDVILRVDALLFLKDFVILDMLENDETPILIGRLFFEMGRALIDVELREMIWRFNKEKIVFNVFEEMKHHKENHQWYIIHIVEEIVKEVVAQFI